MSENKEWNVGFASGVEDEEDELNPEHELGNTWDKNSAKIVSDLFVNFYKLKGDDLVAQIIQAERDSFAKKHNLPGGMWLMDTLTGLDKQIMDGNYPKNISPKVVAEFLTLIIDRHSNKES
ncbi:hypothetical protein KKG46_05860 [Patescibacteria group bacterium]|nr:hypothetical protein [Patescibacteria group bacterium]